MNILSLFDGISCGRVALERAGIKVNKYYASEIDKYAIQIAMKNYPDTIQVGDITQLKGSDFEDIDLIIGGSPCQSLSAAKGQKESGLEKGASVLFWEFVRLLKEINPKYFLLENVNSMKKTDRDVISKTLGVAPIMINSALVSAQQRKRLYWTNIPNITQPEDKHIYLKDILEPNTYTEKEKSYCVCATYSNVVLRDYIEKSNRQMVSNKPIRIGHIDGKKSQGYRVYSIDGKSVSLMANGGGIGAKTGLYETLKQYARKLTPLECERLQTLPTWEIILEVKLCLEQAKNYVNAVNKNLKLQKLVGNVEKYELKEFVSFVKKNMNASLQLMQLTVQRNADMQIEKQINLCINHKNEKSNTNVGNVESCAKALNPKQEEIFVPLSVSTNIIQDNKILHGKGELLQKDNLYTCLMNGGKPLNLYGKEIMQLVQDVEKGLITKRDRSSIFITLNRLGIENLEQMLIICYWYAINVIGGFTADKTKAKSILMSYKIPYSEGISNTQRYRAIGNGWTVDVIAHILKNLKEEFDVRL